MAPKFDCVEELLNNSPDIFLSTSLILLKVANNVLDDPENTKYRTMRVDNAIITEKLLPVGGALNCLFQMGFQEDGEKFVLPTTTLLDDVKAIRDELITERMKISSRQAQPPPNVAAVAPAGQQRPAQNRPTVYMQQSERQFLAKLQSSFNHVLIYEDRALQQKALRVIPLEDLQEKANEIMKGMQPTGASLSQPPGIRDLLLLELLSWFKHSFFSWVDAPQCHQCAGPTKSVGMTEPSVEDLRWGAGRVENYLCETCQCHTRFPRYNNPGKLLETRRGRCGEWANCFSLCCRAAQFETRYVLDWTDHVWNEVYSPTYKRWLHCDSCENACDKPLTYERGWGKKLTYVIAFSNEEVQDVTWRYSAHHEELRKRRTECREKWLVDTVVKFTKQRQVGLSPERKEEHLRRLIVELVDFMSPKRLDDKGLTGRQSGSLAWRLSRGETSLPKKEPYTFHLTDSEKQNKLLHFKYCCAADKYVRVSDNNREAAGFDSLVFASDSVSRKVEQDWKMTYLARNEGSQSGTISWKFDFTDTALKVDRVEVQGKSATYEDGMVSWWICSDDKSTMLVGDTAIVTDLYGAKTFTLRADLRQGNGNAAWQHAQLFRQTLTDVQEYPFEIKITLTT